MKKYTREELINLCEDAVINHKEWINRDSYSAQVNIQSIYKGLTAGLSYKISIDDETIWIEFKQPINLKKLSTGKYLEISSREEYFEDCDPKHETELFDSNGIDFTNTYAGGYIPTRKRLNYVGKENDWY